ncbi:MAG: metallophosphoesterase [Chloroflexi bacterium]|nr:metallophosphoesterase [Chloroflexota bacterium]MCI0577951.1 metallophosphoesterase [Chloroflexota bacterium]MCI0646113.1 metallophosphoesterase [Chloroflexota bacterium]MCI0731561.1 metallophosphoesterase [Chloroflexota bacterium]
MREKRDDGKMTRREFLRSLGIFVGGVASSALVACDPAGEPSVVTVAPTYTTVEAYRPLIPPNSARLAVIGDYGDSGPAEAAVAELVKSWNVDFVVTTGDNNYFNGKASTIDENIGQYYHEFIHPYKGTYGVGADANRFFPALGGHDWRQPGAQPHLDYFTLPGNGRYYDVRWGPVHLFILDSNDNEPDGVTPNSKQGQWLQRQMALSNAPWKLVVAHDPPHSSGRHGSHDHMQWPFKEWGATAVLSGDDHDYERIVKDGLPYFVNGLGGGTIYEFDQDDLVAGSALRFNEDHGAMLVEAVAERLSFQFVTRTGRVVDQYVIDAVSV